MPCLHRTSSLRTRRPFSPSLQVYEGSTKNLYIWNDMNEPSVFNGPEVGDARQPPLQHMRLS